MGQGNRFPVAIAHLLLPWLLALALLLDRPAELAWVLAVEGLARADQQAVLLAVVDEHRRPGKQLENAEHAAGEVQAAEQCQEAADGVSQDGTEVVRSRLPVNRNQVPARWPSRCPRMERPREHRAAPPRSSDCAGPPLGHDGAVPETIEAEVIAIDGASPPPSGDPGSGSEPPWERMRGRVTRLDARWWPLWLLLGAIAVVLLLTVGVVLGLIFLILRALGAVVRWFSGVGRRA